MTNIQSKVRGCLVGGAVGDALGYPVEFISFRSIVHLYGNTGITSYEYDKRSGLALFSDDTQMLLFTADGLLRATTKQVMEGKTVQPRLPVADAYVDWCRGQYENFENADLSTYGSWLCQYPTFFSNRAPGNSCLSSMRRIIAKDYAVSDCLKNRVNDSCGCGGVMRVAPVGLRYCNTQEELDALDLEAAQIGAITHGNSLGYIPCTILSHIIHRGLYPTTEDMTIKDAVLEAMDAASRLFAGDENLPTMIEIMELAIELAQNKKSDFENLTKIGEGWTAHDALADAVYCALRYPNDFSKAVIAAANHNGDKDSTAAIAGNIMGAWLGFEAIEPKWKENLERYDTILELADDLTTGWCQNPQNPSPEWLKKYYK